MTLDWLYEAHRRTRKDGAAGVDAVTGKEYRESLHENLQTLLDRLKTGRYRAPAVRRKDIPKGTGGETRPIGIPTFEDKIAKLKCCKVKNEKIPDRCYTDFVRFLLGRNGRRFAKYSFARLHLGV